MRRARGRFIPGPGVWVSCRDERATCECEGPRACGFCDGPLSGPRGPFGHQQHSANNSNCGHAPSRSSSMPCGMPPHFPEPCTYVIDCDSIHWNLYFGNLTPRDWTSLATVTALSACFAAACCACCALLLRDTSSKSPPSARSAAAAASEPGRPRAEGHPPPARDSRPWAGGGWGRVAPAEN